MEQVYGSMSFISRITGIDRRQIAYWIEHGDDILETKFKLTTFKLKSKKPICICTPMEIRLSNWIIEKRQAGNSIAGYQIKTKAFDIYDEIHPVDGIESNMSNGSTSHENSSLSECSLPRVEFKASDGWLSNFCQRRGFVLRRVSSCGRELPHNCLDIIFTFYRDLTKTIEFNKFEKRQIINMDESCQYLDAPSQYTYSAKGAKRTVVHTTGSEKTRLSGAWTGAADGTKLPLHLIVPRVNSLSNFHVPENVILTYHPDSVFNTETIISYFQRIIIPYKIAQNLENVLLIIDSARCHLTTPVQNFCTENGIYLIYVPPRLTNLLQPADVSWFASLKKGYRKRWNDWYLNEVRVFTIHGNAKSPGYAKCIEWLSELWNNFQSESITKSFITCGIKTHRINGDKIEIDFQNLHGPLKEMIKKNVVINSYIDHDNELEEANLIFTEENNIDIFGQGESQDAGLVDEQAETSEQNKSPEFNGDGLMTSEEQRIFQNLEASVCQRRSEFILKDSTNKLNLNKIKKSIPVQENLEKENMVKYAEFQFTSTPSTSKSQEDKTLSKPTKRKTPEVEQEAQIPKKRGRKLGSKNKKTIEKEARMAEMVSKATNEESVI